ncbi:MAG: sulfotransferase family protein, partial [Planctomycetales bacterium]|nr:sulfotransferase family protein [Planctomycetales bacterium]
TGTKSLKEAIEVLGFGPCHHMHELLENPDDVPIWQSAALGELTNWDAALGRYKSQVDWPGSHYWRELAEAFPEAIVLHSVRPEESWVKSFQKTIGKLLGVYDQLDLPPHIRDILDMNKEIIGNATFDGKFGDADALL